jgi:hypothetical protein
MPLEHEDHRHRMAAKGYVELEMRLGANEGPELLNSDVRIDPEVLVVRLTIYSALEKWELMETVARRLVDDGTYLQVVRQFDHTYVK